LIRFFDTSALAKRYIAEAGSQLVRTTLRAHPVSVARITYAELAACVARAWRLNVISEPQRDAIMSRLSADFSRLSVVEIRAGLIDLVPGLVLRHPLRGYDAVQLATALTIRAHGQAVELWSADETLCAAAAAEGQAKRWKGIVGSPEIQTFMGALQLQSAAKGVFITTSSFTKDAKAAVGKARGVIVLVDGARLTELMIEHGVAVSHKALRVPKVDNDYFGEG
jgi:predicted nucleic acid-binding protein